MPHPRKPIRTASGTRPRPARVLLVEDEVVVAESLRLVLASEFDVVVKTHPLDAYALISAGQTFDVILCDLMMPEMSGEELLATLRTVAPEQARRVVIMTGGAFTTRSEEFLHSLELPHLTKPLTLEGLRAAIQKVLAAPSAAAARERPQPQTPRQLT